MADCVRAALDAGAVGFSTSRTNIHQATDGRPVPGTNADIGELLAIGRAMREAGSGTMQVIPSGLAGDTGTGGPADRWSTVEELERFAHFVEETGRPLTYPLGQSHMAASAFDGLLQAAQNLFERDLPIYAQWSGRPTGVLTTLEGYHLFQARPTYRRLASLPLEERVAAMRQRAIKGAILAEDDIAPTSTVLMDNVHLFLRKMMPDLYPLGDPADYEPEPGRAILCQAAAIGQDPFEMIYDMLLEQDGRAVLMVIVSNYLEGDLRRTEEMLPHPKVVVGAGDAGAHVRMICDASTPTFLLTHWVRDRSRGKRLPVEVVVRKQTADNANLFGLRDRGTITTGKRADLNVIDLAALRLGLPYMANDFPGGGRRYLQDAEGYVLTTVAGVPTVWHDRDTGARPGRLVRAAG
jgi:N-acyl-D-aspartate/D-glutamate deacylase